MCACVRACACASVLKSLLFVFINSLLFPFISSIFSFLSLALIRSVCASSFFLSFFSFSFPAASQIFTQSGSLTAFIFRRRLNYFICCQKCMSVPVSSSSSSPDFFYPFFIVRRTTRLPVVSSLYYLVKQPKNRSNRVSYAVISFERFFLIVQINGRSENHRQCLLLSKSCFVCVCARRRGLPLCHISKSFFAFSI